MVARQQQRLALGLPAEEIYGYSQAVQVGDTVFISGQFSHDVAGALLHAGDCASQCARAFANLDRVLDGIGAHRRQIVSTTVYVVGLQANLPLVAAAHRSYFDDGRPASSALGVAELILPGQLVEIEAVVRLDAAR